MQTQLPVGYIIILYSLYTFYYFNRKAKIRKADRKDRLFTARQNFLNGMLNQPTSEIKTNGHEADLKIN